jgi:uncharacterized protein YjbK
MTDISTLTKTPRKLIETAKGLLLITKDSSLEEFDVKANKYIESFTQWQLEFEAGDVLQGVSDYDRQEIREVLIELQEVHNQVIQFANEYREGVLGALSELHKRGKALRAYVDNYPSRITVTGKREG